MRSSKSRSRSKSNRSRSMGNIVNRVFDSSGPEGKVRGTPQQIIDKYTQLARDAGLGNDRVAAENFQQHAEHYTRLLGEAQREQDARREQQEAQNRDRQQHQQRDRNNGNGGGNGNGGEPGQGGNQGDYRGRNGDNDSQPDVIEDNGGSGPQPDIAPALNDVLDVSDPDSDTSGLVETPENKADVPEKSAEKPSRPRTRTRKPKADGDSTDEAPKPKPKARRKPKAAESEAAPEAVSSGAGNEGNPEAAE